MISLINYAAVCLLQTTTTCDTLKDTYRQSDCCNNDRIADVTTMCKRALLPNAWAVDAYTTVYNTTAFQHFIVYNTEHTDNVRDVQLAWHGSSNFSPDTASKELYLRHLAPIYENTQELKKYVFLFVTTETSMGGDDGWHTLYQDQHIGIANYATDTNDYLYHTIGGLQMSRHLEHLQAYGYVPGTSVVRSSGYSDGAWMSMMGAMTGIVDISVSFAGFPFAQFDLWKDKLPSITNVNMQVFMSANDEYYSGAYEYSSGWFSPPGTEKSMQRGLYKIIKHYNLVDGANTIAGDVAPYTITGNATSTTLEWKGATVECNMYSFANFTTNVTLNLCLDERADSDHLTLLPVWIQKSIPFLPPSTPVWQLGCNDDLNFTDIGGYMCTWWSGYRCDAPIDESSWWFSYNYDDSNAVYNQSDVNDLKLHCPEACTDATPNCYRQGCEDNSEFVGPGGYGCAWWNGYNCDVLLDITSWFFSYNYNDESSYTLEDVEDLQNNCPVSCAEITPTC